MKNKICYTLSVIVLCFLLLVLSACGNNETEENNNVDERNASEVIEEPSKVDEEEDESEIYMKVIKSQIKYTDEDSKEVYFSELVDEFTYDGRIPPIKYALYDIDNDEKIEMLVCMEISDGVKVVLKNEDGTVYGHVNMGREMLFTKKDGRFSGSGGAVYYGVYRNTYNKTETNSVTVAQREDNKFSIDGKSVSESRFNEYYNEFLNSDDPDFVEFNYTTSEVEKGEQNKTISDSPQGKTSTAKKNEIETIMVGNNKIKCGTYTCVVYNSSDGSDMTSATVEVTINKDGTYKITSTNTMVFHNGSGKYTIEDLHGTPAIFLGQTPFTVYDEDSLELNTAGGDIFKYKKSS